MICEKLAMAQGKSKLLSKLEEVNMDKFEKGDKKEQDRFIGNVKIKLDSAVTHVSDLVEIFQKLKANSKQQLSMETKKQNEMAKQ